MKPLRCLPLATCHLPLVTSSRRGSVLLYVVWLVLLLSVFAVGIGSQAQVSLDLSERLFAQLRAGYLARSALQVAALVLSRDPTPSVDGLTESWSDRLELFDHHPLAGGWFSVTSQDWSGATRYGLSDEERRLNLNTAPADVLSRLAQVAGGLHEWDAIELAAAIEDWRDADDQERPDGAEDSYYHSLREAYDCKNGPFENLEELRLIRGVSMDLYQKLQPHLTVYGSGFLNLNTAGPTVLKALGLSESGVAGVLSFRSGEDGREGTSDDRQLVSLAALESDLKTYVPTVDMGRLLQLANDRQLATRSDAFRMLIWAEQGGPSSRMSALCVLDRQGVVTLWSEH